MSFKGLPFIGKMNEFINNQLHPTIQKVGSSRAALETVSHGYYLIQTAPFTVEAGSTDNLLKITGHTFKAGDSIRLKTTANYIVEEEIIIDQIIDANTVKFAGYLSDFLTAGDLVYGRRPITETLASDGTSLASLSYLKDGIAVPVARDTATPTNSTALPVEIMGANGMVLNVTTGDINIQSNHADRTVNGVTVPGDSIKIGDGTDILLIKPSGEAMVSDADLLTSMGTDITSPTAMPAGGTGVRGWLSAIYTKLNGSLAVTGTFWQATQPVSGTVAVSNLPATQPVSIASMPTTPVTGTFWQATQPVSGTVAVTGVATSAKQDAEAILIGPVNETAPTTDTGSSGLNGRLQRVAQNISALILQLPATLGQKVKASSLSVTIASDQDTLNVKQAAASVTYNESLTVAGSGVTTISAPAGARGCKVITPLANGSYINITLDGTTAPSATVGMEIQPGRSEDFIGVGASLKAICQDAGTNQKISVHWYV